MISLTIREIKQLISFLIIYFPESIIGNWLRRKYWQKLYPAMGPNFKIERGAVVGQKELVEIGNHFILGEYASITAGDSLGVYIGNHVGIARYSYLRTANHRFDSLDTPIMFQEHDYKTVRFNNKDYSIVIEDDVWLGSNVTVVSGTHIGKGSVIAAGSVISGVVPPYSVVVGNPGRRVKSRIVEEKKNEQV